MAPANSSDRRFRRPPPRASTDLYVGNLHQDTSASRLLALFSPFSPLDATSVFSPRTHAFVLFRSPSDAARAKASLSAGSMQIEFARPAKPSKHLWVGGLSASSADEDLLKKNFSEFGSVAGFALVRARNSAFLDFATADAADAAKAGMDGRSLAGSVLRVDYQRPFQWTKEDREEEPMSNTLRVGYPASARMDAQMLHNAMILFGEIERIESFPEGNYCLVEFRSVDEARRAKEGLQERLFGDPRIQITFSCGDYGAGKDCTPPQLPPLLPGFPRPEVLFGIAGLLPPPIGMRPYLPQGLDANFGEPNWRMPFPGPGLMPSAAPIWDDGFDAREPKRPRIYGVSTIDDNVSGRGLASVELHHIWRGVIAKGGSHVCHARCVPIGKGLDNPLPEVVNCSARTDLDVLAKHCAEAVGFDVVFFIPDSEDDFASYTEFLRYLGLKSRAGVAKFDDGTTMFLVPPSDFLTEFLKVSGPERLYGVVLRLRQQPAVVTPPPLQAAALPQSHSVERQEGSTSQDGYGYIPQNEDPTLRKDYGSNISESSVSRAGDGESHGDVLRAMPKNPEGTSKVEISLTPELIASLASLIPSIKQSLVAGNVRMASSSTAQPSSFPATEMNDSSMLAQRWSQDHESTYSAAQLEMTNDTEQQLQQLQQFGQYQQQLQQVSHQHDKQAQVVSQYPPYSSLANGPDNSDQSFQDLGLNMPWASYDSYNTHGTLRAPDSGVVQLVQNQSAPTISSAEGQAGRMLQTQMGLPSQSDNEDYSAKRQQVQMALNNYGDGPSQGIADKNQRYQSTLQFAASLLHGIRQQQQGSNQTADGSGKQL